MSTLIPANTQQDLLGKVFVGGIGFMDPQYIRVIGFTPKRVIVEPVPGRRIPGEVPYGGQYMPDPDWLRDHPVTAPVRRGDHHATWKSEGQHSYLDYTTIPGCRRPEINHYHEVQTNALPHNEYHPD
jgi:hypothetical protein